MMFEPGWGGPSLYEQEKSAIDKEYEEKIKNPPWYSSSEEQARLHRKKISQLRDRLGIRGGGFYE